MNFCWAVFKWGLLAGLLGVVVGVPYLYLHVDDQIRRHVEAKLASHYPNLKVSARSAELVEGEGIRVRDVSIVEPGAQGPHAELLHVEEIFLACRGDLEELITSDVDVARIVLRRPTLRATRRPGGAWSASKLLPPPVFTRRPPELVVEDGTIEVFDPLSRPAGSLSLQHVQLTAARPNEGVPSGAAPGVRKIEGTLTGNHLRQIRVEGFLDPERLNWSLAGSVEGLEVSRQLVSALPGSWAEKLTSLGPLRGQATVQFRASGSGGSLSGCRFDVAGRLDRGRLDDPRLARPLTDIKAAFRMNNAGLVIDTLTATSGQATLSLACRRTGYGDRAPLWLDAKIRHLELDRQLVSALPERLGKAWEKFLPQGQVHADVTLAYDGEQWKPDLKIECLGTSFSYHKFPYRLAECTGTMTLKDDVLEGNLTAYAGSQPVAITCRHLDPLGTPYGWVEATGNNIPFDQKLYAAMSDEARTVVRSFDPQGTVNCTFRSWRDGPESPPHRKLVATLNRVRLQYEKFPYPMTNVCGTLEMIDDRWTCRDMEGTNDTARVRSEGQWTCGPNGGQLSVRIVGTNVPLEEELRDALARPDMRKLWNDLRLQGMIDLDVQVTRQKAGQRPTVSIDAVPRGETTSIEPTFFPYRMEKIQGRFHYDAGLLSFEGVKAEHGETVFSSAGRCQMKSGSGWLFRLDEFWVDRLRVDRELTQALPERMRQSLGRLNPAGPMDLGGTLSFSRSGGPESPLRSEWNVDVGFHQGSLDVGEKVENLHGQVKLIGGFDGARMHSRGELAFDSLTCRDVQFTEVMGPIWIDDGQVLLGSSVEGVLKTGQPREVTARVFDGTIFGHGRIERSNPARWRFQVNLSQGDLARCARELKRGQQNVRGKLRGTIDLWGTGRSVHTLGGMGRLELHDADIYELPVMLAMLKILSVREPDLTAFSESDVDFTIEGPHIYFNRINFHGDAIRLEGKGEMNLDTAIRLTFRAQLAHQALDVPLLKDLIGGASEQIMLIHVDGTLADPVTTKEPFPTVNQALQMLQNDLDKTSEAQGLLPQAGRLITSPLGILPN